MRIKGQNTTGDLIELNEKNAVVAFGQLITTLPRNQVERMSNNEAKKLEKGTVLPADRNLQEISLNGGFPLNPKLISGASGWRKPSQKSRNLSTKPLCLKPAQLRILHGKGMEFLKETIRDYLKAEPMVRSFKDEHVDFGGAGITVVNLAL